MKKISVIICLSAMCMLQACDKTKLISGTANTTGELYKMNESYGADAKQKFDIYLPSGRTATTPVLFLIHGGGWAAGGKSDFNTLVPGLKALFPKYAVVSVGYRLAANGQNMFPTQENDVKACIEYVLNNSEEYKISRNFGLWGSSAGAHLALLYAYKYGNTSFQPKAIVDIVGPAELTSMYNEVASSLVKSWLTDAVGFPNTADSLLYKSSSPINYVSATSSPTLMLYGAVDTIVPFTQSIQLNEKLNQFNVPHTYKLFAGQNHGLEGVGDSVMAEITVFLNEHLK